MSVQKKFQSNQSSRLAGYREHIYMNVLFYYIDKQTNRQTDTQTNKQTNKRTDKPNLYIDLYTLKN